MQPLSREDRPIRGRRTVAPELDRRYVDLREATVVNDALMQALRPLIEADRRLGMTHWPIHIERPAAETEASARSAPAIPGTPPAMRTSSGPAGRANVPAQPRTPQPQAVRAPVALPPLPENPTEADVADRLRILDETQVKGCTLCGLCKTRTHTVFGQGSPSARLVFVGEAPGFEEDRQGFAFVGKAGELLTRMIQAMGTTREEVFICNVLKCRPPSNRTPAPDEIAACSPYLRQQLMLIRPEVIVALGVPATQTLLGTTDSLGRLRARFHDYFPSGVRGEGPAIPLMPTYHPAYLLRYPADKIKTWEDLQQVMGRLGLKQPGK